MATIKQIEITTVRFVFSDDEVKPVTVQVPGITKAEPKPKPANTKPKQTKTGRHMWTDDEKREAMRMYAEGEDLDIIAKKFNSTTQSVQKIMQKNGIRRPWPTKGNPSQVKTDEPKEEPV